MKWFVVSLLVMHGVIRILGFVKAFRPAAVKQLKKNDSAAGRNILVSVLFLTAGVWFLL